MSDVTRILSSIEHGDSKAAEELLPIVYEELRRLAAQKIAHERPGQTLQATALVHEAYLRLIGSEDPGWNNRSHFFGAAAEAMRRILVERARRRNRLKRGGDQERVNIDEVEIPIKADDERILEVHAALEDLEQKDPIKATIVKLHFFVGLSHEEIAGALGISEKTVRRSWSYTKVWLFCRIKEFGKAPR